MEARRRWLLFALGWLLFALGMVGLLLPVVPTTPFMLLALWAFSRSSRRFHDWLYNHRLFGPRLRAFRENRVIPLRVKLVAIGGMSASLSFMLLVAKIDWPYAAAAGAVMAVGAIYILRCPSKIPARARE